MSTSIVKLTNQTLNMISDECGLVVESDNYHATCGEIEYFAEQVVRECILTILEQKPENGQTKVYNDLAKVLAEKFGVKM